MKVVSDKYNEAYPLLREVVSLTEELLAAAEWLEPYGPAHRDKYPSLPTYIVAGRKHLANARIAKFDINYPTIKRVVANGCANSDASKRLNDAVYYLGSVNEQLVACGYLIKLDSDRQRAQELLLKSAGDLVIYLMSQYEIDKCLDGEVRLSVNTLCEERKVSPSVFYGELLSWLERTGVEVYGYESLSPWNEPLLEIDPVFVAECEENSFPLTEDICKRIVDGKLTIPDARALLVKFLRESEEVEVTDMTSTNMIARLKLD